MSAESQNRLGEGYRHEVGGQVRAHEHAPVAWFFIISTVVKHTECVRFQLSARNGSEASEDRDGARSELLYWKFFPRFGVIAGKRTYGCHLRCLERFGTGARRGGNFTYAVLPPVLRRSPCNCKGGEREQQTTCCRAQTRLEVRFHAGADDNDSCKYCRRKTTSGSILGDENCTCL